MIDSRDIQRMFDNDKGVLTWRDRPYTDFLSKTDCDLYHKMTKGTQFKDGDYIHMLNDHQTYTLDELYDIMADTFPAEPSNRNVIHNAIDTSLSTHSGDTCNVCSNRERYDDNEECATCVKYDKRGEVVWTRSFVRDRIICYKGVFYWKGRPRSDFDHDREYKIWNDRNVGKRIPRVINIYLNGIHVSKPITKIIDTYYSKPVT